jgi:hypothetical protein
MDLKCEKCGHIWDYKGKSKWYLACPNCDNMININALVYKNREKQK